MVFREVDGKAKIAFVNDASGRHVAHIDYDTNYPSLVFQQVNSTLDKQSFNYLRPWIQLVRDRIDAARMARCCDDSQTLRQAARAGTK